MRNRIVGDVSPIERNGLTIEVVGKRLVGRGWIAQSARSQGDASDEIFVELTVDSEAHTNAGQIVVWNTVLDVGFAAYPDVTAEPETSDQRFQRA